MRITPIDTEDSGRLCGSAAIMDTTRISLCLLHVLDAYNMMVADEDFVQYSLLMPSAERQAQWKARREAEAAARAAERERVAAANGIVYYVRFGDRIKIGTTVNLKARLSSVPHDEILATEPGDYRLEGLRHQQFKHCHVHREWFDGTDAVLLRHIAMLQGHAKQQGA